VLIGSRSFGSIFWGNRVFGSDGVVPAATTDNCHHTLFGVSVHAIPYDILVGVVSHATS
jgi:hypothetical protein